MIGVVLAAHGPLPDALLTSVGMIIGDLEQVATVSLMPGDSLEGLVDRIREEVKKVDTGSGVLICLDLFGGTPSNAPRCSPRKMTSCTLFLASICPCWWKC